MTLNKAIEDFIGNITVTDKQEDLINGAYCNIESNLLDDECPLGVKDVFLNGSYVRDTMIRPLDDIDIFAVIDKDEYNDNGERPNPQTVLSKFKKFLNDIPDYKDKVSQDRPCVTITLNKIQIDVLPSLREYGLLYIPNESLDGWSLTDPKTHTANLNSVNDKHNGMVKDVVKAVKSWKKRNGYRIPSFHIEEIAIGIFNIYSLNNLEEGIRKWFNFAKYYIQKERFNTDNQYNASLDAINDISDELTDAKSKKDNNNEPEAIKIWHSVFGKDFPTISEEDAKKMNSLLTSGNLKYGATTGLSAVSGHSVAASKGFYGEK